ncbi:MAG: hypothetical protein KF803_02890 [Cyclobacteriaceae bacterium]|nr:hypothetical protein [Cyclobacteriaceae bacterium]
MNSQVEAISKKNQFATLFHPGIDQHWQQYLYNRQHDLQALIDQDKKNYLPLNHANLALGRFCKKIVQNFGNNSNEASSHIEKAEALLQKWQERFNQGGPFDTYPFAEGIFLHMKSLGVDIDKEVQKDQELAHAFINLPPQIKSFFQFHILVPEQNFEAWSDTISQLAMEDMALFYYIREFTIYTEPHAVNENALKLVRIKLIPEIVQSRKNPVLNEILELLQRSNESFNEFDGTHVFNIFAEQVDNNIYLSQGNTNYKKFLSLTCMLEDVYCSEKNHAYLN